ncbi:MAG TPA: undecaprenyldiphospho-muramoylpentapeptide beta-N-acetylglucosaminyltransferase [Acidiferrobacterales bacterium]
MSRVLIMAGGTGGHVFPALAVARQLRDAGTEVVWLGTRRGLEARLVPAAGFDLEAVAIRGARRGGWVNWLLLPMRLAVAMFQAWRILRRRRPDAVLAMGGFVAGPGGLMTRVTRTPLLIHEQNAVAGLTNRWLAYVADVVMSGFPDAFGALPGVRHVGNPVRAEILALPAPEERLTGRGGRLRVLVVGGSQGAQVFNQVIPQAVGLLPAGLRPEIRHQTGRKEQAQTERAYHAITDGARVAAFIDDMAEAYRWADLVVCRAGAMTIAELAAAGVASVLVPYPHAVDDHQTANARFLAEREAAILLSQPEFTPARVAEVLTQLAGNRELLMKMAIHARGCAVPDATEAVARLCEEAAHA